MTVVSASHVSHGSLLIRIARVSKSLPDDLNPLPIPAYQTSLASGFDLAADIRTKKAIFEAPYLVHSHEYCVDIEPGEISIIPTGFIFEVPPGFELQVRPRGGTAIKKGVTVINTPGTLDADYRGELMVGLVNLSKEKFRVTRGDRIAQAVICPVMQATLVETPFEKLSKTVRGDGKFNSTGVK